MPAGVRGEPGVKKIRHYRNADGKLLVESIRPTTGPNTPFWRTPPQDIAITDTALTAEIFVVVFCDFMELL